MSRGCVASVRVYPVRQRRRSGRGPTSRVGAHIVDLEVRIVILGGARSDHVVVVLHTNQGQQFNRYILTWDPHIGLSGLN